MARPYKRAKLFPHQMSVGVDEPTRRFIATESAASGESEASVIREALSIGLPRLRDRSRKRRDAERKKERKEATE